MNLNTFLTNHRYGKNPETNELAQFNYYDFEKKFIGHISRYRFSIVKKSRQMHLTNLLAHFTAWHLLYNEDENLKEILYFGHNIMSGKLFVKKVSEIISRHLMTSNYKEMGRNTSTSFYMTNGNSLRIDVPNPETTCGYSLENTKLVIMDEFAFWKNQEHFISALIPTLGSNTTIVIISSPNGKEFFNRLYKQAKKGKNMFTSLNLSYIMNPEWTDDKIEDIKKFYSKLQFKQEIEGKFVQHGKKKLNVHIDKILHMQLKEYLKRKNIDMTEFIEDFIKTTLK